MAPPPSQPPHRADLADASLRVWLWATLAAVGAYFLVKSILPAMFRAPGSPMLQAAAILGALLLLTPLAFAAAKRSGRSAVPNRWFIAHVLASLCGFTLVAVHTAGKLGRPPALLLLTLVALAVSGAVARLRLSRGMAATLGTKAGGFAEPDPALRKELGALIARKATLLAALEPGASEATFTVGPEHWLTSPRRALAYSRLAAREAALIGSRRSVPVLQGYWRPVHIALAWLFLAGLAIHVAVVTFFAGWAADGREIYWWHLTAW